MWISDLKFSLVARHHRVRKYMVCHPLRHTIFFFIQPTGHINRAMTHNEDKYPEPMRFMPQRFLTADGSSLTDDIGEQQFGFGRRCVAGFRLRTFSLAFVGLTRFRCAGSALASISQRLQCGSRW